MTLPFRPPHTINQKTTPSQLDAGVPEEVLLMSRDEQSLLVASYADIRRCVEGAYAELRAAASRPGGR